MVQQATAFLIIVVYEAGAGGIGAPALEEGAVWCPGTNGGNASVLFSPTLTRAVRDLPEGGGGPAYDIMKK